MSPWMLHVFIDRVMKKVRKYQWRWMHFCVILKEEINDNFVEWLMFAGDTLLLGEREEILQELVEEFERVRK